MHKTPASIPTVLAGQVSSIAALSERPAMGEGIAMEHIASPQASSREGSCLAFGSICEWFRTKACHPNARWHLHTFGRRCSPTERPHATPFNAKMCRDIWDQANCLQIQGCTRTGVSSPKRCTAGAAYVGGRTLQRQKDEKRKEMKR